MPAVCHCAAPGVVCATSNAPAGAQFEVRASKASAEAPPAGHPGPCMRHQGPRLQSPRSQMQTSRLPPAGHPGAQMRQQGPTCRSPRSQKACPAASASPSSSTSSGCDGSIASASPGGPAPGASRRLRRSPGSLGVRFWLLQGLTLLLGTLHPGVSSLHLSELTWQSHPF